MLTHVRDRVIFDRRCGLCLPLDVCFSESDLLRRRQRNDVIRPMATVHCRRPINQDFIDLFDQQGSVLVLHL